MTPRHHQAHNRMKLVQGKQRPHKESTRINQTPQAASLAKRDKSSQITAEQST